MNYPKTKREDCFSNYHGNKVNEPYKWLESDSKDSKKWINEQNENTSQYINTCKEKSNIFKNLESIYNYEKVGIPFKRGSNYFYYKNNGLQNHYVLYIKKTLKDKETVLIDPNELSKSGTTSLKLTAFSEDGKYLIYGLSKKGSDWCELFIKDIQQRTDLKESLKYCKFASVAWKKDNSGFYYTRYPQPKVSEKENKNEDLGTETDKVINQKIYFHKLNTKQEEDKLVYFDAKFPKNMYGLKMSHDGLFLLIYVSESCSVNTLLYYVHLENSSDKKSGNFEMKKLIDKYEASYDYITNEGSKFYFQTNLKADRDKIITIDLKTEKKEDLIPESEDVLLFTKCINQKFLVVGYMHNVCNILKLYDLNGKFIRDIVLPGLGSIGSIGGRKKDSEFFYKYTSFNCPGSVYRYDFKTGKSTLFYEIKLNNVPFDLQRDFETKQVWFKSKDGTKVPMFVTSKKGLKLDGNNPVMLYGYGGFNISLEPYFSAFKIAFIYHMNGIFALPNIRGGSEFGKSWHEGGIKEKKQNVFDDFQCAAEYLIKNKYTKPSKICIEGYSNGGLLTAACVNQRPDLFGGAIIGVGVLDMLKFHKFTIGSAWVSDYGCSDNKKDFEYLIKYSPLHNVKSSTLYPSVLITTSDHDDRVVPLHSFKFAAALQHIAGRYSKQTNPLLIRIEQKAGHGAGKPTKKILEEYADIFSFVSLSLNAKWGK